MMKTPWQHTHAHRSTACAVEGPAVTILTATLCLTVKTQTVSVPVTEKVRVPLHVVEYLPPGTKG